MNMSETNEYNMGISRRDALKRMGMLVAGAAALGMPSALTSCVRKERKHIIFYFTATGNSLYVARQLADEHTELLSIPQLMKRKRLEFEADEIGIVYPFYGQMPPNMVRRFIQKARLEAAYKFAVLTYGNMQFVATELWDEISRKAGGAPFDYITSILMVDNWLPNFDMSEQIKTDKHIPESLGRIKADLAVRKHEIPAASEQAKQLFNRFIRGRGLDPSVGYLMSSEDYFVITDACVGCAVCTEVCPRGNYKLTSMGVKTEGDCDFCFSCIQNCPQKASSSPSCPTARSWLIAKRTPMPATAGEHVSLWSIKESNRQ